MATGRNFSLVSLSPTSLFLNALRCVERTKTVLSSDRAGKMLLTMELGDDCAGFPPMVKSASPKISAVLEKDVVVPCQLLWVGIEGKKINLLLSENSQYLFIHNEDDFIFISVVAIVFSGASGIVRVNNPNFVPDSKAKAK
jgi:hypothetical protein